MGDRGGFSQAVFINIVGDIRVGNLAALAEKLNLAPLQKVAEALKQSSVPKE